MTPRIRHPLATWLLTVFTSGLYFFYWAWRIASELNSAEGRIVLNAPLWKRLLFAFLPAIFVTFIVMVHSGNPVLFFVVAVAFFAFLLYVQFSIGNYIKAKDRELNTGRSFSNALSFVLFWMLANIGAAYMQIGINRVIQGERARS